MSYPIETVRHSLAHVMAAAVKKYNGNMVLSCDDSQFTADATMFLREEQ